MLNGTTPHVTFCSEMQVSTVTLFHCLASGLLILRFMYLVLCPVLRVSEQNVRVWHAGAGQADSSETVYCPVQTAGGG